MSMITCGLRALLTASHALSLLCQMQFYFVRTSLTGLYLCDLCLFVFLFAGRCLFWFLVPTLLSRRPAKDNGGRATWQCQASPGSDKSDDTQGILKSMQTMIGMYRKLVI